MDENFPKILQQENDFNDGLTMLDTARRLIFEFRATNVKWYDSYPDVKMHDRLLEFIDDTYHDGGNIGWKFIRVGEEHGDVDEKDGGDSEIIYELHDDFYPTQGMEIPFNAGYKSIGDVLTGVNQC